MEKKRLDYLVQQYKWNYQQIKHTEIELIRRKYLFILFIIYFFFVWIAAIVFTIDHFNNSFIEIIIANSFIFTHIWVAKNFSENYFRSLNEKNKIYEENISKIEIEIDDILEANNINKDKFYRELFEGFEN